MNILQDIKTAIKLTGEVRKARKAGASGMQVKPVYTLPVRKIAYWGFTMEGCLFYGPRWQPIWDVFNAFPEERQHALTFTPEQPGGWMERARFWQRELRPVLPPVLYHEAMLKITHHYARCKRMRLEAQS